MTKLQIAKEALEKIQAITNVVDARYMAYKALQKIEDEEPIKNICVKCKKEIAEDMVLCEHEDYYYHARCAPPKKQTFTAATTGKPTPTADVNCKCDCHDATIACADCECGESEMDRRLATADTGRPEGAYVVCTECGASDSCKEVDYDEYKDIKKKHGLWEDSADAGNEEWKEVEKAKSGTWYDLKTVDAGNECTKKRVLQSEELLNMLLDHLNLEVQKTGKKLIKKKKK